MNALQIMSPRQPDNQIDWSKIEYENFTLPTIYKSFHNVYDVNTIRNFNYSYISKDDRRIKFGDYDHLILEYLILESIYNPTELEEMLPKMLDLEDEIDQEVYQQEVIPIACTSGGHELLMLGIGKENADKVYYFARYEEERLKLVADNIFEFFKDYYIKIDEFYLNGTPLSNLYRNWGEDFWRVREDPSTESPTY